MDWKIFPSTQASVFNQELSQNTRVSLEKLSYNLDALLNRDKTDCLAKQLDGLLRSSTRIYQVKPRFRSIHAQKKVEKFVCVSRETGKRAKCNVDEGTGVQTNLVLQSKTNYSRGNESRGTSYPRNVFFIKESPTPPELSPKFSVGKGDTTRLQLTSDSNDCKEDVLPSNGFWQKQDSSDSEMETKAGTSETDCSAILNLEEMGDDSSQCFRERVNSFSNGNLNVQEEQLQEQNGRNEPCNFLHLTSEAATVETCLVPRPPQTTPVLDDATCLTLSEDEPLLRFNESLSTNAGNCGHVLKLDYWELLQHRRYTTSRTSYDKSESLWYNSMAFKEGINKECNDYKKSLEIRNKSLCSLPRMNHSKVNKITPVGFTGKTVEVKRRQTKGNVQVKLKLHHRSKCFAKFSGEAGDDRSTDERVLPTSLNKPADVSYSIMSPYMANVVWSVMDEEKVR